MSFDPTLMQAIFSNKDMSFQNTMGAPTPCKFPFHDYPHNTSCLPWLPIFGYSKYYIYSIEDVAFNSQTDGGHLKYSMPSIMDIHGVPYETFNPIPY